MPVKGREKQEHGRAGLWRRLGAAWIDMFVIYAVAEALIAVTAMVRIRLALAVVRSADFLLCAGCCTTRPQACPARAARRQG